MKGDKNISEKLNRDITDLDKKELALFHSYNRHANSETKLKVLRDLQDVIVRRDALKRLKDA